MTISNYTELKTAVANWSHRTDLTSVIPDFILIAEKKLMDRLRIRAMENVQTGDVAATIDLPTGFKKVISLTVTSGGDTYPLTYTVPSTINADMGSPLRYSISGEKIYFLPVGTGTYTLRYYAALTSVVTNDNWLITNAPDAYLFASLIELASYTNNDEMLQKYSARLDETIARLSLANLGDRYGNNLMVRAA